MTTRIAAYEMNPAKDMLLYSDELRDGMWVMRESRYDRCSGRDTEDHQIRMNRFCRVTRLRTIDKGHGPCAVFIGEWVDGYQKSFSVHHSFAWIVMRESTPSAEAELSETGDEKTGDPS